MTSAKTICCICRGQAVQEPHLKKHLQTRRGAAGLTLQWVMFGSGGHRDRPQPGGPLRHFDECSDKLSFEMKCLAASHHLCDVPFIKPTFLHACGYKYAPCCAVLCFKLMHAPRARPRDVLYCTNCAH